IICRHSGRCPLSLHDALPIYRGVRSEIRPARRRFQNLLRSDSPIQRRQRFAKGLGCVAEWREDWTSFGGTEAVARRRGGGRSVADRKSTRLNSSHQIISYAVF